MSGKTDASSKNSKVAGMYTAEEEDAVGTVVSTVPATPLSVSPENIQDVVIETPWGIPHSKKAFDRLFC